MEQVRHARIPVHLNAVLIGEKTVPKGCTVRNVSRQGLLLQCDADGRILTFRDGDYVDIHLLFRRSGGTKYHTVAANVRHVEANGIGVEFCQPDAELVKLIESYRVADTQSIEATITHRRKAAGPERSASVVAMPAAASPAHAPRQQPADDVNAKRLSYIGLLSVAIAVIIFTAGYLRTFGLVSRVSELETLVSAHEGALAGFQSGLLAPANTAAGVAEGDKPPKPAVAAKGPAHEPPVVLPVRERAPGTAATADAPEPEPGTVAPPAVETSPAAASPAPGRVTGQRAPVHEQDQAVVKNGPWVINLMSSPDKSDADRFAENARKQGIQVEQTTASLKGREFFRVQMTGFVTEKQARAGAGPVQERLGLKDVWIFKP